MHQAGAGEGCCGTGELRQSMLGTENGAQVTQPSSSSVQGSRNPDHKATVGDEEEPCLPPVTSEKDLGPGVVLPIVHPATPQCFSEQPHPQQTTGRSLATQQRQLSNQPPDGEDEDDLHMTGQDGHERTNDTRDVDARDVDGDIGMCRHCLSQIAQLNCCTGSELWDIPAGNVAGIERQQAEPDSPLELRRSERKHRSGSSALTQLMSPSKTKKRKCKETERPGVLKEKRTEAERRETRKQIRQETGRQRMGTGTESQGLWEALEGRSTFEEQPDGRLLEFIDLTLAEVKEDMVRAVARSSHR